MAAGPEDPSMRRVISAASVTEARLPEAMLRSCIHRHKVKPAADGLWHFEQRARTGTSSYVLQLRPRELEWFELAPSIVAINGVDEKGRARRMGATQGKTLQHAVRDLSNATVHSAIFASCAQIEHDDWPAYLRMWTNGESVFVRKIFTPEVWVTIPRPVVRQIRQYPELFGFKPYPPT